MRTIACESENNSGIPIRTIGIVLICLLIYNFRGISDNLIYDRIAISNGELWRLMSSHLVHYNKLHLFYNLIAFGIAGWGLESMSGRALGILCLSTSLLISLIMYLSIPEMSQYAGLSGITCGIIIAYALYRFSDSRWLSLTILILAAAKIGFEFTEEQSLLPYPDQESFALVPQSHLIGCLTALTMFMIQNTARRYQRKNN